MFGTHHRVTAGTNLDSVVFIRHKTSKGVCKRLKINAFLTLKRNNSVSSKYIVVT